jgi:formate transporter FocA
MVKKSNFTLDALLPSEMASKAEDVGAKKAGMSAGSQFTLPVLAGAFIALGAVFATTVAAGTSAALPFGLTRLLAGLAFSLGLILVVVGGAELFTGNILIVMGWASGKVGTAALLRNWAVVYMGNFAGALATAVLMYLGRQYQFGNGCVGATALATAQVKLTLDFGQAVVLGILCNGLVCLAVWLTYSCRTTADKILAVIPPISAFVAAGFEHSVANMYFIPVSLFVKAAATEPFWSHIGKTAADYPQLTWGHFLLGNLLPVTLGNIIGGAVLVGAVYWFMYLRKPSSRMPPIVPGDQDTMIA